MSDKLITCKHCGAQIAKSAKVCPSCGGKNKKPIYLRWWFIALVVIVILGVAGSAGGNKTVSTTTTTTTTSSSTAATTQQEPAAPAITYEPYSVNDMVSILESNALKASDQFKDHYLEVTGKLRNIDSGGSYIDLGPTDNDYSFTFVQCYIKDDDAKAKVMNMTVGQIVTLRGQCTDVGEILGYSLDIDSIQ